MKRTLTLLAIAALITAAVTGCRTHRDQDNNNMNGNNPNQSMQGNPNTPPPASGNPPQ